MFKVHKKRFLFIFIGLCICGIGFYKASKGTFMLSSPIAYHQLAATQHFSHKNSNYRKSNYAGLIKGNICYCTSEVRTIANALKPGNCDILCFGERNRTCGGANSVDVFQMHSSCFKGDNVPASLEENKYLGCFTNDHEHEFCKLKFLLSVNVSATPCILRCGLHQYPLAAIDVANTKCVCGWFTEKFNLLNRDESCGESSVKLYRTLSEDKRCPYPQFLPLNSSVKRALLTSFPGSGNSWTRHLIEHASQIFTGSEYQDGGLYKSGMLGELTDSNRTFVIKSHSFNPQLIQRFRIHSVIMIIRNPYDAYLSEYNRQHSHGHKSLANETSFYSKEFLNFVMESRWKFKLQGIVNSKMPFHLLVYENLRLDPIGETRKIMKFLEINNGFRHPNLEQRLLCLAENLEGQNKRSSRKLKLDPYSNEMVSKINSDIEFVRKRIALSDIDLILPPYERTSN